MPTHSEHQQLQRHQEQPWWEIEQVTSEIPGQGFGHFEFQTPEEGRLGGPAKIKGILTPVQPQTKAAQKQLMDQQMMQGVSKYKCELKKVKRETCQTDLHRHL